MDWLDYILKRNQGEGSKKIRKLTSKLTNKHIDEAERYSAVEQLRDIGDQEAIRAMLNRFNVMVESGIKDNEEKQYVYEQLLSLGENAVNPVMNFLRTEKEISWPLKALSELLPPDKFKERVIEILGRMEPFYSSDKENAKKVELIEALMDYKGEDVIEAVEPFLEDTNDDVRIAALELLARHEDDKWREFLIESMLESHDRPRIRIKIAQLLCRLNWPVTGYRKKVEAALPDGFYLDGKGHVKAQPGMMEEN